MSTASTSDCSSVSTPAAPLMVKSNSVGSALGFLADSGSDARGSHWAMASQIAHRLAAERAQTGLPSCICAGTYYHGKAPGEHGDRTRHHENAPRDPSHPDFELSHLDFELSYPENAPFMPGMVNSVCL